MPAPLLVRRLGLAAVSTLLALGGAWWYLQREGEEESTIEFVGDPSEFRETLIAREAAGEDLITFESTAELGLDFARRLREDLTEQDLHVLFPQIKKKRVKRVPGVHYALLPNKRWKRKFAEHPAGEFKRHTNSMGIREKHDPPDTPAGLNVLVMGDSHAEGVCSNPETLANQLEAQLRRERSGESVEVWNLAVSGYGCANYLGTLTAYGHLEPQDVVLVSYGGNDFRDALGPWWYLYRRSPGSAVPLEFIAPLRQEGKDGTAMLGQEIHQALTFLTHSESGSDAARLMAATGMELDRQCRERGARFLFVYLPPPSVGQPEHFRDRLVQAMDRIGADPEGLTICDSLADATLVALEQAGVATLDLRPSFAATPEPLYWHTELHLNVSGHALVADQIHAALYGPEAQPR